MSWIVDSTLTWFQRIFVNIIKCGPIPRHVALIMDGNRRYASKTNVKKAEGHVKGFDKLAETLQWCLELGIREVTVYAFSIENFKRSKEEVDTLMHLAREKFERLLDEKDKLMAEGVCIRIIGDLSLLPHDVRKLIAEAILLTKDNDKAFLNVAFAYTSRDELKNTIRVVSDGIISGSIDVDDVEESLLSKCLYSNDSYDPDILVRTSGEVRFSDFLLWQISNTNICFTQVLWPEFCVWHLLTAVFKYQRSLSTLRYFSQIEPNGFKSVQVEQFVNKVNEFRLSQLREYCNI